MQEVVTVCVTHVDDMTYRQTETGENRGSRLISRDDLLQCS